MKFSVKHCFRIFREGMAQVVCSYPVELVLAVYAAAVWLAAYEADWSQGYCRAAIVPLFFALSLAVNRLSGRGPWRRVYWVVWTPLIPLSVWGGLNGWIGSTQYLVSLLILAPLALLLSRRGARNERFVSDTLVWLRSFLLAELFANVALGLFAAILFSTTYIFGLHGRWIEHVWADVAILTEALAVPCLFLLMAERWRNAEISGNRILAVLLDYIVAPALLIYTAILYLYAAKILFTWSLPEGGVAYLVFGFTIVSLCVKALQLVLEKRRYDWFFDRFSLVSLPLLLLFWVGVMRRVSEYGLTEPRVWLLVCGGIMTLCVFFFLVPRIARYRWVCALAFGVFALVAFVPVLRPARIAVRSQFRRALTIARRLDLLRPDGTVQLDRFGADTALRVEYRRFYEAAEYLSQHDSIAFSRFGVSIYHLGGALPQSIHDYVVYGLDAVDTVAVSDCISLNKGSRQVAVGGYATLFPDWSRSWHASAAGDYSFRFQNDTLRLRFDAQHPDWVISATDLLAAQLRQAGIDGAVPSEKEVQDAADRLLVYRDRERMILFGSMDFERSDSTFRISGLSVSAVLLR